MSERKRRNKLAVLILALVVLVSVVFTYLTKENGEASHEANTTSWAEELANAGLFHGQTESSYSAGLSVEFIDVGQGDCTLVTCDGKSMLIDCGEEEYYQIVRNYLENKRISRLDIVVASHPHTDHMGGMYKLIEDFEIGTFIMPETEKEDTPTTELYQKMISALKEKEITPEYSQAGKNYYLSDAEIEILGPVKNAEELNDMSVVLMLKYGKSKFLFTGDAEEDEEIDVIESGADLKCNVLKVAHHGSDKSSCEKFLKEANPDAAVISVGEYNEYYHPHTVVLERLLEKDVSIYRTDEDGTVRFYVPSETSDITYP